jgi:hypothetical protein
MIMKKKIKKVISIYRAFHNFPWGARENEQTREGTRMCNFKENKIYLERYSRKDNLNLTNQKPALSRYVCHSFTLLGFNKKANLKKNSLAAGAFKKCQCQIKFDKSMRNLHIIIMYSATDYLEMIIIFGECGRNAREAARVFSECFPNRNHPDHKVILRAMARTQEIGQVLPNGKECGLRWSSDDRGNN